MRLWWLVWLDGRKLWDGRWLSVSKSKKSLSASKAFCMDTEESRAEGGELMPTTYPPLLAKRQKDCCLFVCMVCAQSISLPLQYVCRSLLCIKLYMFDFFLMIILKPGTGTHLSSQGSDIPDCQVSYQSHLEVCGGRMWLVQLIVSASVSITIGSSLFVGGILLVAALPFPW